MQIDTYLHKPTPNGRSLGFSALMSQITDSTNRYDRDGNLYCWLSITRCNKEDKHFNKKLARAALNDKAQSRVKVRDLPIIFAGTEARCYGLSKRIAKMMQSEYNYVLRKFV